MYNDLPYMLFDCQHADHIKNLPKRWRHKINISVTFQHKEIKEIQIGYTVHSQMMIMNET